MYRLDPGWFCSRNDMMAHEILTYEADGLTMRSQLFFEPGESPRPGILVFPRRSA